MDFNLSEDQKAFQSAAREFAHNELAPKAAEWDAKKIFPKDVIKKAAALGFCGIYTRSDIGGTDLSRLDAAIIFEELAWGCTSTTAYITIHNMVTWMIDVFANEDIRQNWGPKMCAGEMLGSYCLTEPGSGSDAAALLTTAKKDGEHYIVNGSKAFVSGGGASDVLVLMCRTGEAGPKGISTLVVPTTLSGISYGEQEKKLGWNSQPTCVINFDNVKVPTKNLLSHEGDGFKIAMKGLDGGRINIGTCSIGAAQFAMDKTRTYMSERKQFGKSLDQFQALQFKFADMLTKLVAARQMIRLAAHKLDNKDPEASTFCAMAKRFSTDAGFEICNDALQLHGGYGYTQEYPIERTVRDTRVHQILEGTNEIMRLIIARRALSEDSYPNIK